MNEPNVKRAWSCMPVWAGAAVGRSAEGEMLKKKFKQFLRVLWRGKKNCIFVRKNELTSMI